MIETQGPCRTPSVSGSTKRRAPRPPSPLASSPSERELYSPPDSGPDSGPYLCIACHCQLWEDLRLPHDRHEVGVAGPAGDDVPVEVVRDPGAGDDAQVHPD